MSGIRFLSYFVIQEETGLPVGYTTSELNKYFPWLVWQEDTGIIHKHRGNGLGLAVKYQMLEKLLEETEAKYWLTGNNVNNVHMRRINETLGYEIWNSEYSFEFERDVLENKSNPNL
jgi:hypothetical protein